jgi:hypothetical protein
MDIPEKKFERRKRGRPPTKKVKTEPEEEVAKKLFPRVRLLNLDHGQHVEFHERFRAVAARHQLAELDACEYYREYLARCSVEETVFRVIREGIVTPEIDEGEKELARMYREFQEALATRARDENPGVREKAARVIALMNNFGEIGGLDYWSISYDYGMIVWILRVYAPLSLIQDLGLLEALTRFDETNLVFRELVQKRCRKTMLFPGARLHSSRSRTDLRFREMIQYIERMMTRDGEEAHPALAGFVREVNELTAPYVERIAMRVKRQKLRRHMRKDNAEET